MAEPEPDTLVLDYYYDDPYETELHGLLTVPAFPLKTPEFTVVGWKGLPNVLSGTPAYQAAQVWGAIATTLAYVMNLKSDSPYIKEWSSTYNLVAIPRAGNQLNAYYDRSSLRFFWGKDPKTNISIYTCDAVGIVAHELGHAILDAIRPDLWNTAVLEFFAFHESFGDILAIASVLQHDVVIEKMLKETTNAPETTPDLWQSNIASRLARQLGHAIYYSSKMVIGSEQYLRNAFNDFKYIDPLKLTLGVSETSLTQEPHNFSRIFTGAWYECFCEIFKLKYDKSKKVIIVKETLDFMMKLLLDAILIAPSQLQFLPTVAITMINILEKNNKLKELEIIKKVFKRRNLFIENKDTVDIIKIISTAKIDPSSAEYYIKANLGATIVNKAQVIQVELPKTIAIKNGEDIHNLLNMSVMSFLNYVTDQHLLGEESDNNMFAITEEGKLMRNYICSSFKAMPQMSKSQSGDISH